jgi:hypothetical protein
MQRNENNQDTVFNEVKINDMFFRDQYIINGQLASIVGAYFGIVFDVIYLQGTPQNVNDMPKSKKYRKMIARVALGMLLFFAPTYFINNAL